MFLLVATAACLFAYVFIFSHETLMTCMFLFLRKFNNDTLDAVFLPYELVNMEFSLWDTFHGLIFEDEK